VRGSRAVNFLRAFMADLLGSWRTSLSG